MPRSILKSSRDKALPELPSSSALETVNTRLNAFCPRNAPVLVQPSQFHPTQRSASRISLAQGSQFVKDSRDDITWTLTHSPSLIEHGHGPKKDRTAKRKSPRHHPRSNRMQGNRRHSSRSSRASSIERHSRISARRRRGTNGYGSGLIGLAATSRTSERESYTGDSVYRPVPRLCIDKPKPVEGLRIDKRKTIFCTTATTNSSHPPRGNQSSSSKRKELVVSPLLVASTKSNLRRRPRVDKRGSMSETDPDNAGLGIFALGRRASTARHTSSTDCDNPEATPTISKCSRPSNPYNTGWSPVTVHSLPLILPADAEYKCRIEWESDKEAQGENDEAGNLWKRLERECGISTMPLSPSRGLLPTKDSILEDAEHIPRRGRWKVKVVETPKMRSGTPNIGASCRMVDSPFSEQTLEEEDLGFSEGAMIVDDDSATVLREIPITDLIPSLSAYQHLSYILNKRVPSRHRRRSASGRSTALRLTRSKIRLSRMERICCGVHKDVKRAVSCVWEDCDDGFLDDDRKEDAIWASPVARMASSGPSVRVSRSGIGRAWSGYLLETDITSQKRSLMNQDGNTTGLGIAMHRSATLNCPSSTMGADSVIDFYVGA